MESAIRIKMFDKTVVVDLSENMLTLSTIKSLFLLPADAVVGLWYEVNGMRKGCITRMIPEACFVLPDGWQAIEFFVETDKAPSRPVTPMNEDSTKFDTFSNNLLYTRILLKSSGAIVENVNVKYPCASFYSTMFPGCYFVISTRHGSHECLEEGDHVNVYNTAHQSFVVKVVFCCDERDFVLFKSLVKLSEHVPTVGSIVGGHHYVILGYAKINQVIKEDDHLEPCFASGIIMSSQPNALGHVCGTSGGVSGLSGGPVFDLVNHQLIGICVSTDDLDDRQTTFGRFSSDMINYCKEITIVRILPVQAAVDTYFSSIKRSSKATLKRVRDQE